MQPPRQSAIRPNLILRSRILRAVRGFFEARDFLEVDTPVVIPAPAPEAYIDAQPVGNGYLHTSPELCMKRLLAAGYARIFQICKCFRRQERGRRHLPEFTLLEWYVTDATYLEMMQQTEALIQSVAAEVGDGQGLSFGGGTIDLTGTWPRMSVAEAFARFASLPVEKALAAGRFDEMMATEIEPNLGRARPLFLFDYPAACGALARLKPPDFKLAERFELYVGGLELCNAFSELTDPLVQRARFEEVLESMRRSGKQPTPMPDRFLAELGRMPPAAGNALGVDRLTMLFANAEEIDGVVAFTPEEL